MPQESDWSDEPHCMSLIRGLQNLFFLPTIIFFLLYSYCGLLIFVGGAHFFSRSHQFFSVLCQFCFEGQKKDFFRPPQSFGRPPQNIFGDPNFFATTQLFFPKVFFPFGRHLLFFFSAAIYFAAIRLLFCDRTDLCLRPQLFK